MPLLTCQVFTAGSLDLIATQNSAHDNWISSVKFSPDGTTVVSASYDASVKLWDAATLQIKAEQQGAHSGNVWSVVFSPTDNATIVSVSSDMTIKVWAISPTGAAAASQFALLSVTLYSQHSHVMCRPSEAQRKQR